MTSNPTDFDLSNPTPFNLVRSALLRVMLEHAIRGSDAAAASFLDARLAAGAWAFTPDPDQPGALRVVIHLDELPAEGAPLLGFDVDDFNGRAAAILDRCRASGFEPTPETWPELYRALLDSTDDLRAFEALFDDDENSE